jgi:RNA polymerase sigma factor (sigma-70 family)
VDALAPAPQSHLAVPRRLLRLRSDAALAERYAQGDEAAFSILFERHRASVFAVCMGVLGSRHDAEDAAQESFAALAVTLRSSPPRELRAWLARVARNAAIDAARRRRARAAGDGPAPEDGPLRTDDVSCSHDVKDEFASLLDAIRELPESQRTALLMRELAGHSYREIGDLLELDEDAVRGLIARARIGLRSRREAAELPCSSAREAIAAEPDGRRHDKTVRRHIRGCAACRAYRHALRDDARALRGIVTAAPVGGMAGGGAVVGLAAKGALLGGAVTQVTTACAVSVCAVGGIALLSPSLAGHHRAGADARSLPASASGSHAHRRSTAAAHGASRSPAGSGSVGAARLNGGAATQTGAQSSRTVVLRSRLSVAHAGGSTTGRTSTRAWGQPGPGGAGAPSASPQPGGTSAAGQPAGGSPSHGGPSPGTPTSPPGGAGAQWAGSRSGPSGPSGMGTTQAPRTYGPMSGGGSSSGSFAGATRHSGNPPAGSSSAGTSSPQTGS